MNTFNLFKQIDEELEEKIGLNISDYFLNYDTDVEKKEILNSVEPNTIQIMSDLDSSWTADYDNLTIKQTIKIENPSYLFWHRWRNYYLEKQIAKRDIYCLLSKGTQCV